MRKVLVFALLIILTSVVIALAQTPQPPSKLTFQAKPGAVTYDHAAHLKREKNDCKVCHPVLFVQDSKAPLNFKPLHKKFEDAKTACGSCHRAGGTAFATAGNCANSKCHVRAGATKG
jgi:c(7)-type cytochrome triheme protein